MTVRRIEKEHDGVLSDLWETFGGGGRVQIPWSDYDSFG